MKRKFGTRSLAVILTASIILSASSGMVSAKTVDAGESGYTSAKDVSDTSASKSNAENFVLPDAVAMEGDTLVKADSAPTGLTGSGTQNSPYLINTVADLLLVNNYISYESSADKHFKLNADLDLSSVTAADFKRGSETEFDDVYALVSANAMKGNANVKFVFDGAGHKMYGLNVKMPSEASVFGIFGIVKANSSITNLTIENCTIRSDKASNGAFSVFVAQNLGSITNCTIKNGYLDLTGGSIGSTASEDDYLSGLRSGRVYKGASLVCADNAGVISGVKVITSDMNKGIRVKGYRKFIGAVAGQNRGEIRSTSVSGTRIHCFGSNDEDKITGSGVTAAYVGMIAGRNNACSSRNGDTALIDNCTAYLNIGGDLMYGTNVGGITGSNADTISNSAVVGVFTNESESPKANANIYGDGRMGGIAGTNTGLITSSGSYNVGACLSSYNSNTCYGGIVGFNSGKVTKCVASGIANTNGQTKAPVGGIIGNAQTGTSVSDCYALVKIFAAQNANVGAVIGKNGTTSMLGTTNYWSSVVSGCTYPVPNDGTTGDLKAPGNMINIAVNKESKISADSLAFSFAGSSAVVTADLSKDVFSSNSAITASKSGTTLSLRSTQLSAFGYVYYYINVALPSGVGAGERPVSVMVNQPVMVTETATTDAGTSSDAPIVITTYEQFCFMRYAPSAHYKLGADIVVGSDWKPIAFSGTLDGNQHTLTVSTPLFTDVTGSRGSDFANDNWKTNPEYFTSGVIKGLKVVASGTVEGSLFGNIANATIDNVDYTTTDGKVVLSSAKSGALADSIHGNVFINKTYVSVPVTVTATKSEGIGGLIGYVDALNFLVIDSGSASDIHLSKNLANVGGLIGNIASIGLNGAVKSSYATGTVSVNAKVNSVAAYIVIGAMDKTAVSKLVVGNCYFNPADATNSEVSYAKLSAPKTTGIHEFGFEDSFYNVDPNGHEPTVVSLDLPVGYSAFNYMNAEDFEVSVSDTDVEIQDVEVDGRTLLITVLSAEDADDNFNVGLTAVHNDTGLLAAAPLRSGLATNAQGYYEIREFDDLAYISEQYASNPAIRSGKFMVCADIDCSDGNGDRGDLLPMAQTAALAFTGEFVGADKGDGTKYTISNLHIYRPSTDNGSNQAVALFGYAKGAKFDNIAFDNVVVEGYSNGYGVLVGYADFDPGSPLAKQNSDTSCVFTNIDIDHSEVQIKRVSTVTTLSINTYTTATTSAVTNPVHNYDHAGGVVGCIGSKKFPITSTTTTKPSGNSYNISNITVKNTKIYRAYEGENRLVGAFCIGGVIGDSRAKGNVKITDVTVDNVKVEGFGLVGGIVGKHGYTQPVAATTAPSTTVAGYHFGGVEISDVAVNNSKIYASYAANTAVATTNYVNAGGVIAVENTPAGFSSITNATVSNSEIFSFSTSGTITNYQFDTGGIGGHVGGVLTNCVVDSCKIGGSVIGGIVGRCSRTAASALGTQIELHDCQVKGETILSNKISNAEGETCVQGTADEVGGLLSCVRSSYCVIDNCSVGPDVLIFGKYKYGAGFVGNVTEQTGSTYTYQEITIRDSLSMAKIELQDQITDSAGAQGVGYVAGNPVQFLMTHCALGGSVDVCNSACGGAIGRINGGQTYGEYVNTTVITTILDSTTDFALDATKAGKIVGFGGTTFSSSNFMGHIPDCFKDNVVTTVGAKQQNRNLFGNVIWNYYANLAETQPLKYTIYLAADDVNKPRTADTRTGILNLVGTEESVKLNGNVANPLDITITNQSQYVGYSSTITAGDGTITTLVPYAITNGAASTYFGWASNSGIMEVTDATIKGSYYELCDSSTPGALQVVKNSVSSGSVSGSQIRLMDAVPATSNFAIGDYVVRRSGTGSDPVVTVSAESNGSAAVTISYAAIGFYNPDTGLPFVIDAEIPVDCSNIFMAPLAGSGTVDDPWLITNAKQLDSVRNRDLTGHYALTKDIVFYAADFDVNGGKYYNGGQCFIPIGYDRDDPQTFTGSLDGRDHKIIGIQSNGVGDYVALFASTDGALFKNLELEGFQMSSETKSAAVLAGSATNTKFENVTVTDATLTANLYAGALAAYATNIKVKDADLSNVTIAKASYGGGLFGHATRLTSSANSSIVDATSSDADIENVTIDSVSVTTTYSAASQIINVSAGVVAEFSGTMHDIQISGSGAINGSIASGVVGIVDDATCWVCSIENVDLSGTYTIKSERDHSKASVAGIVGKVRVDSTVDAAFTSVIPVTLTIDGCSVGKNITVNGVRYAGGVIGNCEAFDRGTVAVENTKSFAKVIAVSANKSVGTAGSIAARVLDLGRFTVKNSVAGGSVSAAEYVGGILGHADKTITNSAALTAIGGSFFANTVISAKLSYGGNATNLSSGAMIGKVEAVRDVNGNNVLVVPDSYGSGVTPFRNIYYSSYQIGDIVREVKNVAGVDTTVVRILGGQRSTETDYHEFPATYSSLAFDLQGLFVFGTEMEQKITIGDPVDLNDPETTITMGSAPAAMQYSGEFRQFTVATNVPFDLETIYAQNSKGEQFFTYDPATSVLTMVVVSSGDAVLRYTNGLEVKFDASTSDIKGRGTQTDPYVIRRIDHLMQIDVQNNMNTYYVLGADLDFNTPEGLVWASEDWNDWFRKITFKGHFSGKYYTYDSGSETYNKNEPHIYSIKNLNVTTGNMFAGFFSALSGTLEDIKFENCSFTQVDPQAYTGLLPNDPQKIGVNGAAVGIAVGFNLPTGIISGVEVVGGSVEGPRHAGGLAGMSLGHIGATLDDTGVIDTSSEALGCTVDGVSVTGEHSAGGIVGAGISVVSGKVLNSTVTSNYMSGGIAGGTITWNGDELNSTATITEKTKVANFYDCHVENTSVTADYAPDCYAGGIVGVAEDPIRNNWRKISFIGCTVSKDSTITAGGHFGSDDLGVIEAQNGYSGGILGYLDDYYSGFEVINCEMYGTVVACGDIDIDTLDSCLTSAGGLIGASRPNYQFRTFYDSHLTFRFINNVASGSVNSPRYAGGIAGWFRIGTPSSGYRIPATLSDGTVPEFISGNIISTKFTNTRFVNDVASDTDNFGILVGEMRSMADDEPNKLFASADAFESIRNNYYSSVVSKIGNNSTRMFGTTTASFLTVEATDVAVHTENGRKVSTFKVKNNKEYETDDGDKVLLELNQVGFDAYVLGYHFSEEGYRAESDNDYLKPIQIMIDGADNDLGIENNTFTVYSSNNPSLMHSGVRTTNHDLALNSVSMTSGAEFSDYYLINNDLTIYNDSIANRYAAVLTVKQNGCPNQPNVFANIGYGLELSLVVLKDPNERVQDGSFEGPFLIGSAKDFAYRFFSDWAKSTDNYYLTYYYEQTADFSFTDVIRELQTYDSTAISSEFRPIGTAELPFRGGYNGGKHVITDFTYNGTENYVGLFGYVYDDTNMNVSDIDYRLKNIHIEIAEEDQGFGTGVSGKNYVGGLVGCYNAKPEIVNCSVVYGTVSVAKTATEAKVGGLVGGIYDSKLKGCFTSTDVRCESTFNSTNHVLFAVGGIVGSQVGLRFETKTTEFEQCFTSSDVMGPFLVGSFIGEVFNSGAGTSAKNDIDLQDCMSTGSVTPLLHKLNSTTAISSQLPSLVVGGRNIARTNGAVATESSVNRYVSAHNVLVAGTNTTEFTPDAASNDNIFYYPTLFGMVSAKEGTSEIYYDSSVIGRISVPTGLDRSNPERDHAYVLKTTNELFTGDLKDTVSGADYITAMSTADLTSSKLDAFDSACWDKSDDNLYPVLVYGGAHAADYPYFNRFAKLAALPVNIDGREADDITAERTYVGFTYPTMIAKTLGNESLTISSSKYSVKGTVVEYPVDYDVNLFGNGTDKETDLLFKSVDSQYMILRNSYLAVSDSVSVTRDEKSPAVTVTMDDGTHRSIRIPLRAEKDTVYVATERQLRAIMTKEASGTKFYTAYRDAVNQNIRICADIDLNPAVNFVPIRGYKATGNADVTHGFNGSNCVIRNLTIDNSTLPTEYQNNVGFFASLVDANDAPVRVQNVILSNVKIKGGDYTGALVGRIENDKAYINNCTVITEGPIGDYYVTGNRYVGGLIGSASECNIGYRVAGTRTDPDTGTKVDVMEIINGQASGAKVNVSGANFVGGFAGYIENSLVANCFATGTVTMTAPPMNGNAAAGGFVGQIVRTTNAKKGDIQYTFASGDVNFTPSIINTAGSNGALTIGIGGFAGIAQIPIQSCFSSGNVLSQSANGYSGKDSTAVSHNVGGLIGYSSSGGVQYCYSSSRVEYKCDEANYRTNPNNLTVSVGGLVGNAASGSKVQQVYFSGVVDSDILATKAINGVNPQIAIGAVVGRSVVTAGTAVDVNHAYYDFNNSGTIGSLTMEAVGGVHDTIVRGVQSTGDTSFLGSFSTNDFCTGVLNKDGRFLSSTYWDYDNGENANCYPYLKSFGSSDVSDFVRFPAVLSIVAVRPSDRDISAQTGNGFSMALTMPRSVNMKYYPADGSDAVSRTYYLQWSTVEGAAGGLIDYGTNTFAPVRTENDDQEARLLVTISGFNLDADNESSKQIMGYYEKSYEAGALRIVEGEADTGEISIDDIYPANNYIPKVGDRVAFVSGFSSYGEREITKTFLRMLGTEERPYLISSVTDLEHIFFNSDGGTPVSVSDSDANNHAYDNWYSPLDPSTLANVEGVVHFRLISNIDMRYRTETSVNGTVTKKANDQPFTAIGSMAGNQYLTSDGKTISFKGIVIDGNDYSIENFNSSDPLIDCLDSTSTVKNIVINGVRISGTGDLAVIRENDGTIDGVMLMDNAQGRTSESGYTTNVITTTDGNAAGIVAVNNGTIKNCIARGTITGTNYVGGIAAENNGTITMSVADATLNSAEGTLGVGGLVGLNAEDATIDNSITLGSVDGSGDAATKAGGFVGVNEGEISDSYSRAAVTGSFGNTASFVGENANAISNVFSSGVLNLSGTTAASTGSVFAASNTGTIRYAAADKALLGSNTYMLFGDAEFTENIISGVALDPGSKAFVKDTSILTNGYPMLKALVDISDAEVEKNNDNEVIYTKLKHRLLNAYSVVSAATLDSVNANYVDALSAEDNVVTTVTDTQNPAYVITPAGVVNTVGEGTVVAKTSGTVAQKISAGSSTNDDLKYVVSLTFDYNITDSGNPNFASGSGTAEDPYKIGVSVFDGENSENENDEARSSFSSLAYYGKLSGLHFELDRDIFFYGDELPIPITKFGGSLNGNGFTVSGITVNDNNALISEITDGAEIKNIGFIGLNVTADPSEDVTNFGMLAGTAGEATVSNTYVVGELKVSGSTLAKDVNVGGLIGKTEGTTISGVVTSGYVSNAHTFGTSTVGGVVGSMTDGEMSKSESTAFVYGDAVVGGIIGTTGGDAVCGDLIYAGTTAQTGLIDPSFGEGTPFIHQIIGIRGAEAVGDVYYDRQMSLYDDSKFGTGKATNRLVKDAVDGFTNAVGYYPNPVAVDVKSDAFTTGLNFALSRLNVSLAGAEGNVKMYDTISVNGSVGGKTTDNVTVREDRTLFADQTLWLVERNSEGTALKPSGNYEYGYTAVRADLNTASNATFPITAVQDGEPVTGVYRYTVAQIVRVIAFSCTVVGADFPVGVLVKPDSENLKVSANAFNATPTETTVFSDLVVPGDGITIDLLAPEGYTFTLETSDSNDVVDDLHHHIDIGTNDDSVHVIIRVTRDHEIWGLREVD